MVMIHTMAFGYLLYAFFWKQSFERAWTIGRWELRAAMGLYGAQDSHWDGAGAVGIALMLCMYF